MVHSSQLLLQSHAAVILSLNLFPREIFHSQLRGVLSHFGQRAQPLLIAMTNPLPGDDALDAVPLTVSTHFEHAQVLWAEEFRVTAVLCPLEGLEAEVHHL